jgi:hypothetical protein
MFYDSSKNGLYLVMRKSAEKGVDHYGILDRGNLMGNPNIRSFSSIVIHLMPSGLCADWFRDTEWCVIEKIADETGAIQRLREALSRPTYNLIFNNCEHFARHVAGRKRESTQVQAAVAVASFVALPFALAAFSSSDSRS